MKESGEPDPKSWHGGLSVGGCNNHLNTGKWTLQMFTTLPSNVVDKKEFLKQNMKVV